ncbi:NADP-dependent phosphogluconate dehydrogenase [Reichenbachiella agariperforans]|uniref:NADP-dependent phosphogluconate dehydrogenase n=1 Tax=Reichenbachiella agariperforans TaxID=156994 RepID=UPI001C08DC41|nr:NADP-dependent phosphogluconate dehydrogenase [Reichenbachiella agariperforans]MBU2915316.1 NADP-dependent phosphogluconate dehydrogenase [Reichenbachiella agariperforans]
MNNKKQISIIVVLGVSGSGKSTVGTILAETLKIPFDDGDDFHPIENKEKMASGQPLNDQDRQPWLESMARHLAVQAKNRGGVLACSALKEIYRQTLGQYCHLPIQWVYLSGSRELLEQRLSNRQGHFFKPELLQTQLETMEPPRYAYNVDIAKPPKTIVSEIIENMNMKKSDLGLIGLGVMGKSLTLNLAHHDINVSAYNRSVLGEEHVAKDFASTNKHLTNLQVFDDLSSFVKTLISPRKIMLMVNAGPAVDHVIQDLLPFLEEGDIIIDGGNSHYHDTTRRIDLLNQHSIHFVGCGVSGGEEGALKGPSIMPGGDKEAVDAVLPYLKQIAARDQQGKACCTNIGLQGSGHFVKMVHNGIEYAEMQLIAEAYTVLREGAGLSIDEIAVIFKEWNQGELQSYLLEITADILMVKEGDVHLVELIYDAAQQKGTGGWSTTSALEVGAPFGTISEAVMARCLSAFKPTRVEASKHYGDYPKNPSENTETMIAELKVAYQAARVVNHAIGFEMIRTTSTEYRWDINLSELARIWTNGCIIRSSLMEQLVQEYSDNPLKHTLLIDSFIHQLKGERITLANTVAYSLQMGIAMPVFSAAINYLHGFTSEQSSAHIIQAQRDYFGSHTYKRKDRSLEDVFHTDWQQIVE